jgi:hypothetical protein
VILSNLREQTNNIHERLRERKMAALQRKMKKTEKEEEFDYVDVDACFIEPSESMTLPVH